MYVTVKTQTSEVHMLYVRDKTPVSFEKNMLNPYIKAETQQTELISLKSNYHQPIHWKEQSVNKLSNGQQFIVTHR